MILSCKHTQPVTLPDSLIGWHAQWACVGVCTFVNLSAGVPCYLFSNACTRTAYDYISEALYAAMFTSVCVHRRVSAERWTTADKRMCISHSTLMQGGGGDECLETTLYSCWDRTMATCWASTSIVSEYIHISLFSPELHECPDTCDEIPRQIHPVTYRSQSQMLRS